MNHRQNFIETQWVRYPAMPQASTVYGRITEISDGALTIDGKTVSFTEPVTLAPTHQEFKIEAHELKKILRIGDQISILGSKIFFLSPCLAEAPDLAASMSELKKWRKYIDDVREFFKNKNFLEVSTPTLVDCPGTEPFLDLFSTDFISEKISKKYFLPTSPELHLKKMVASGHRQIFEMRSCFRNGEISENHQPEFWMLEWYRAYANLKDIVQDTQELVQSFSNEPLRFEIKTMRDLFKEKLNFELHPDTSIEDLKALGQKYSLAVQDFDLWDDVFYFIFVEKIEKNLGAVNPLFVTDYPPSQAALARLTEEGWGDRFELYWRGLEIANAFHELNDPEIQKLRFAEDLAKKKELGKQVPPLDQNFMKALESGMPPSGGIALGLERLYMALNHVENIEKTRAFPLRRN